MLPIRRGILEFPRTVCDVLDRREPECLAQCLVCGSLLWSRAIDGEPECRCSIASGMRDVAKEPQLTGVPA